MVVPVRERPDLVAKMLAGTQGVLLPGCRYDVEPERYGAQRTPGCGEADPARAAIDELLLQDGFNLHKPVLAICYGVQSLNVWRNGTLIQDLAEAGFHQVNHAPGRHIAEAHPVEIAPGSRLERLAAGGPLPAQVNSSHHQALGAPGDNLQVTAVSPADGVIEAIELQSADHFVVGVQWHPERTYTDNTLSRALFAALVHESGNWRPQPAQESVTSA